MNKMKKFALAFMVATPMMINAAGMGIYVPFNVTETEAMSYDNGDYTAEYKSAPGFGIAFDSNIGKDKLYNYRLGVEYHKEDLDSVNGHSYNGSTYTKNKFNIVNTFGFGVFRNKVVRLWVGPRLNVQFQTADTAYDSTYSRFDLGVGLAAAAGVNVNLGSVVSLAFDLDYHAVGVAGSEKYEDEYCDSYGCYSNSTTDSYSGTNKGITARFYLLFRFGEKFDTLAAQPSNQSVIDQSL